MQWLLGTLQTMIVLGFLLLVAMMVLKSVDDTGSDWFRKRQFAILNVVLASAFQISQHHAIDATNAWQDLSTA